MAYQIEFAESVTEHLRSLRATQRATVLRAIEKQLVHEPVTETRNKKPLRPNPIAPWELRVGSLRVFYEIASDDPDVVRVLAIGRKKRNRLYIGGKVIEL
ncbi:MAG: type II toxin-antitoxin system RelE/ParE family toxin [Anaerolineae bacterium]